MTYFIILIACRRNPADRVGLDKALMGENLEREKLNQHMLGLLLLTVSMCVYIKIYYS